MMPKDPPNVKCLVLYPMRIDASSSKAAAAAALFPSKPECNPMKEVHANSIDSLQFLPDVFGIYESLMTGVVVEAHLLFLTVAWKSFGSFRKRFRVTIQAQASVQSNDPK